MSLPQPRAPVDYVRVGIAALAATAVDLLYGTVVYGTLMADEMSMNRGIYRRVDQVNANLPWLIAGLAIAMAAASYLYARFSTNTRGVIGGARFGAIVGLIFLGYVAVGNYVVMRIGQRFALLMGAAGFVEWIVVGAALGFAYGSRREENISTVVQVSK